MGGDLQKRRLLPWCGQTSRQLHNYQPGPFALIYTALLIVGVVASALIYEVLVKHVPGMDGNRADAVKTALLVVGGSGALAGLYVAYRKQRTDEANHLRDQDKLFTERYTQAVAQLGNAAAAVRLGGVYALARIADDSARDRPTCLNVLCAYLRMPYDPTSAEQPGERQVRTAAQTALAERLRPDHPGFWQHATVDLSGAHLIDFDFSMVEVSIFKAAMATFSGNAAFRDATFSGLALFNGAIFRGDAWFGDAVFSGDAGFATATFGGDAWFGRAAFSEDAWFSAATFRVDAWFSNARFGGDAWFGRAAFSEDAEFGSAVFTGFAEFGNTVFSGDAGFGNTLFTGDAEFGEATFSRIAKFDGATFSGDHPPTWPNESAEPSGIVWQPAATS